MEEQQPAQPSVTPKKFPWKRLSIALIVFILVVGGMGTVLAWRTTYLDPYLPAGVKEFFGRGEEKGEEEEEAVPPVISLVKATNITETGATITWTTDVEATSQVEYGTTTSYGSQTTEDTTLVTSHSVPLSGLTKATLYHYRVISESAEGGGAISEDYTFTTEDPTKDWKTWENKSFGISFKYPKTYQITKEEGIAVGKYNGELVLHDQTRSGNPKLNFLFDQYGGGGACNVDIAYRTAIENGGVEILSRTFSDRAKTEPCNEDPSLITHWAIDFAIGAIESACMEDLSKGNYISVSFSFKRTGPDYESELKEIIKTISITKEEIYCR